MPYYQADLCCPEQLADLDSDFEQVFYMPTPGRRDIEAYRAVYQTGLQHLLNRLNAQIVPPQWFFISSTSVYGQSKGEWVDENSAADPSSASGKIIRQGERLLQGDNPQHIIVRFSGIYGPGRERLLKMAAQTPTLAFNPPYFTNRIHQDDCAAVLAFLSARHLAGHALDNCYLASDDQPAPLWEVMTWLAEQLQYPQPIAQTTVDTHPDQNKRCNNQRLKTLGFHFNYPSYREGYLPLVR